MNIKNINNIWFMAAERAVLIGIMIFLNGNIFKGAAFAAEIEYILFGIIM